MNGKLGFGEQFYKEDFFSIRGGMLPFKYHFKGGVYICKKLIHPL